MKAGRYAKSRQKACLQCSTAKAKCDRATGCCARCALRGLSCTYHQVLSSRGSVRGESDDGEAGLDNPLPTPNISHASGCLLPSFERQPATGGDTFTLIAESRPSMNGNSPSNTSSTTFTGGNVSNVSRVTNRSSGGLETLDFSDLELVCPINVNDISNRWLNSYVPVPGQKVKEYPASITAFIYRILKSYATVAVHGRGVPPFVHASQVMPSSSRPPLSTCLTLVRICQKPLAGSESVAADVLQREMSSLYEGHWTYDDMTLLSAFQAYLIYSMVLFFRLCQGPNPFLRQAMMNLQNLACSSSRQGLMCIAEQQRIRPRWEAWIVAEAKRRTLFAMYLFDSVLSAQDGLPTFLGTELEGLPAPANHFLWKAHMRHEWETAFNIHLVDWVENGLRIDELWPIPANLDESAVLERRNRVDQWLENVDEFGTMLYAVTSCTHGG